MENRMEIRIKVNYLFKISLVPGIPDITYKPSYLYNHVY